ncbi:YbhB/YbcL family Raf kinase inhibitor-like protein [Clostridium sp.]|uniref:YbhB/YbcL family Raf kinase inhibitor-like protein n=1 Tax=Clostridium sp. TaxID=1506 RepID=UPI001A471430|nr:YbhB/YbcL family Raf kinase inhibitor-like protein [Clostridium sp.]MBK5239980.1 YbhB/YbcL family Raf kinase inhibitor-like protein [Clostridium sp.]
MTNDLFATLSKASIFQVTSTDVIDGQPFDIAQYSGIAGVKDGQDLSPQLYWHGAPKGTKSYAVTVYDPDAPTGSGFWHWAVANIPATVTELKTGSGDDMGLDLPRGAIQLHNDASIARFMGAAPPHGHGKHRYVIVIHALDIEDIGVSINATPAALGFQMFSHTLGRAVLTATAEL